MLLTILLLCIFFLFLVPTLVLSVIARIVSFFRGDRQHNSAPKSEQEFHEKTYTRSRPSGKRNKGKKIFDKSEGEYVDFEEIK